MAVTQGITLTPLQTTAAKTGSHTHNCTRGLHVFTCSFTTSCVLEMLPNAQALIDTVLCPQCISLGLGKFGS